MAPKLSDREGWQEPEASSHRRDHQQHKDTLRRQIQENFSMNRPVSHFITNSERTFVVKSQSDLPFEPTPSPKEDGPIMAKLLDSVTSLCICHANQQSNGGIQLRDARKSLLGKRRVVYPVEAFSSALDSPSLVEKRRRCLKSNHFFRPVSEDEF